MKLILYFVLTNIIGLAYTNTVYDKSIFRPDNKIGNNLMECSDCSSIKRKHCNILETNFVCSFFEDRWKVHIVPDPEDYENNTSPYNTCTPPKYTLVGVLESFCCFWSPEMGCRQLKKAENDHEKCSMCIETEKDMFGDLVHKYCPCSRGQMMANAIIISYLIPILLLWFQF